MIPENTSLTIIFAARYRGFNLKKTHSHMLFQLYILSSDQLEFCNGNETFIPDWKRELILVKPGKEHILRLRRTEKNQDWLAQEVNCALDCKFSVDNPEMADMLTSLPDIIDVGDTAFYIKLASVILNSLSQPNNRGLDSALSALNTILYSIIMPPDEPNAPYYYSNNHKATDDIRGINAVKRYLDIHYHEQISLENLVQISAINRTALCKSFHDTYGFTPIDYLLSRRIHEAELYLVETNLEINKLAERVGFTSATYFSRLFRKRNGITPSEYRQRKREEMDLNV